MSNFVSLFRPAILAVMLVAQTVWHVGDRVEAGFMGSSYTYKFGNVVAVDGDRYKVHFDGYDVSYESWVPVSHVRPIVAAAPAPVATPTATATAAVAGNQMPACEIGMVVRAGALNYDAKIVEFSKATGMYKVQYVTGFKGDIEFVPPTGLKTCSAPSIAPVAEKWFVGVWQLFNGGGGAWQKNPTTNTWKVIGLDVAGAPPIRFSSDGTYEWVIDASQTIRGAWRTAATSERKYGYEKRGTTIILLNGESGKNWLVSRQLVATSDGRDQMLMERVDLGLTYHGQRVGPISH